MLRLAGGGNLPALLRQLSPLLGRALDTTSTSIGAAAAAGTPGWRGFATKKKDEAGDDRPAAAAADADADAGKQAAAHPEPQQSEQQQQPGQPEDAGTLDPRLQQHIEQLRQLKGATRLSQQTLGRERQSGPVVWLATWLGGWVQRWIEGFIKDRVEKSFSAEEFVEGAKDAYYIVHTLIGQQDWDTLAPMVSSKLLEATRSVFVEYGRAGLTWNQELEGDVDAAIRGVSFWTRDQMAAYDEKAAAAAPEGEPSLAAAPAGLWLVVTVGFHARQKVRITRLDDANVVAELTDLRPQRFRFARGPLPGGASYPVDELEGLPWTLITIF